MTRFLTAALVSTALSSPAFAVEPSEVVAHYADLAAAAHLSCVDFLGDVSWGEDEAAKHWYARVKSRPSFRAILSDRLPGITPAPDYADLDF